MKRRVALAVAAAITLAAGDAVGDAVGDVETIPEIPDQRIEVVEGVSCVIAPCHITVGSTMLTFGGVSLELPPGYFVSEPAWDALDLEVHRLQDQETRLAAENASLRASARSGAPWWAIGLGVVVGAAAGVYVYERVR